MSLCHREGGGSTNRRSPCCALNVNENKPSTNGAGGKRRSGPQASRSRLDPSASGPPGAAHAGSHPDNPLPRGNGKTAHDHGSRAWGRQASSYYCLYVSLLNTEGVRTSFKQCILYSVLELRTHWQFGDQILAPHLPPPRASVRNPAAAPGDPGPTRPQCVSLSLLTPGQRLWPE